MKDRNLMMSGNRTPKDKLNLKQEYKLLFLISILSLSVKKSNNKYNVPLLLLYTLCPDKYITCFRILFLCRISPRNTLIYSFYLPVNGLGCAQHRNDRSWLSVNGGCLSSEQQSHGSNPCNPDLSNRLGLDPNLNKNNIHIGATVYGIFCCVFPFGFCLFSCWWWWWCCLM